MAQNTDTPPNPPSDDASDFGNVPENENFVPPPPPPFGGNFYGAYPPPPPPPAGLMRQMPPPNMGFRPPFTPPPFGGIPPVPPSGFRPPFPPPPQGTWQPPYANMQPPRFVAPRAEPVASAPQPPTSAQNRATNTDSARRHMPDRKNLSEAMKASQEKYDKTRADIQRKRQSASVPERLYAIGKLSLVAAIALLCLATAFILVRELGKERKNTIMAAQDNVKSNAAAYAEKLVSLPNNKCGNVIKAFYEANGKIENYFYYRDALIKGSLVYNGTAGTFYCIKKTNGKSYIKIETAEKSQAFLVGDFKYGVKFLPSGTVTGEKLDVPPQTAATLRGITSFTDSMFIRAFTPKSELVNPYSSPIYAGESLIDGATCNIVEIPETDKTLIRYYLDAQKGVMPKSSMTFGNHTLEILYDAYRPVDSFHMPYRRKIMLDGKLVAEIDTFSIAVNRGIVFPQ